MKIVYDVVNTILFHEPSIPILYSMILKKNGYQVSPEKIKKIRNDVMVQNHTYPPNCCCKYSENYYNNKWNDLVAQILIKADVNEGKVRKIAREIHFTINNDNVNLIIEPSFFSTIDSIKKSNSLGILSNGYPSVKKWLASLNIQNYFDFALLSSEIGHQKPCPLAFSRAHAERVLYDGISVYVGDDYYEDGIGAIYGGFDAAIIVSPDNNIDKFNYYVENKKVFYTPNLKFLPDILKEVYKRV